MNDPLEALRRARERNKVSYQDMIASLTDRIAALEANGGQDVSDNNNLSDVVEAVENLPRIVPYPS